MENHQSQLSPVKPGGSVLGCVGFTLWDAKEMKGQTVVCGCHNGWLLKSVMEDGVWLWRHLRSDAAAWGPIK